MHLFTDPDYFRREYQAMEVGDPQYVSHRREGDEFSSYYRFRATGRTSIPAFARKFVGDAIRVQQTDRWRAARHSGRIDIEIAGVPATGVGAQMRPTPKGARACRLSPDWVIRCSLPLLGGKVEKLIAEDVERRMIDDGRVSVQRLEQAP